MCLKQRLLRLRQRLVTKGRGKIMKTKILLLSSVFVLTACMDEGGDLQQWMTEQKQIAKGKVKPPVGPEPVQPVTYFAPGQISPHEFNERRMRVVSTENRPELNRPKELLEEYPLENLKFVGSIGSGNGLSGLIEYEGHVYTVKKGNYIGQNFGRVSAISADSITITEAVENADGGWSNRYIQLGPNGVIMDSPETETK